MTYWIIWSDYDGTHVEDYPEGSDIYFENRLTEILAAEKKNNYGVTLHAVLDGERLNYEVISVVDKVKIG